MKTIRHISVSIDTFLGYNDVQLGVFFEGDGAEIRKELEERKSNGELRIGPVECVGFDPINGCPGHPQENNITPSKYRVNIDMTCSQDIIVTANNAREAKKKAFEKFKETKIKPKHFRFSTNKLDENGL